MAERINEYNDRGALGLQHPETLAARDPRANSSDDQLENIYSDFGAFSPIYQTAVRPLTVENHNPTSNSFNSTQSSR